MTKIKKKLILFVFFFLIFLTELDFFNVSLNERQKESIYFMNEQPHLAVLYGPPGTGKTTVLVELVMQAVKQLPAEEKVDAW